MSVTVLVPAITLETCRMQFDCYRCTVFFFDRRRLVKLAPSTDFSGNNRISCTSFPKISTSKRSTLLMAILYAIRIAFTIWFALMGEALLARIVIGMLVTVTVIGNRLKCLLVKKLRFPMCIWMHFIKHRLDQITFPLPAAWPDQRGRPNNAPGVFSRLTFISKQVYELQEEAFVTTSSCVCPQRANCLRGRSPNSAGCELASLDKHY